MASVSVIIPSYNHAQFLKQRIDSVLNQEFEDFEVIILDDCSRDRSREVINIYKGHPKINQIIFNETNSGSPFAQWEKGVKLSEAEYIWIAESDDFSASNFLSTLLPILTNDESLGIVYCQSLKVNDKNDVTGNWKDHTDDLDRFKFEANFRMHGPEYIYRYLIHKNTIPNASAVIFRKNFYQKAGGSEPSIKYCGDWITWMKILLLSDIYFVSEPLNFFRYHENSVIAKAIKQNDSKNYIEKHDRSMRKKFQVYLDKKHIEKTNIIGLNYRYIAKEDIDEEIFNKQQVANTF